MDMSPFPFSRISPRFKPFIHWRQNIDKKQSCRQCRNIHPLFKWCTFPPSLPNEWIHHSTIRYWQWDPETMQDAAATAVFVSPKSPVQNTIILREVQEHVKEEDVRELFQGLTCCPPLQHVRLDVANCWYVILLLYSIG